MRWTTKVPKFYNERIVVRFLFIPKSLYHRGKNKFETRWLEFAEIVQKIDGFGWYNCYWYE